MADVTKLNRPLCASLLALAEKSTSGLWSLHVHRGIPGAHISEARTGRAIFWTTDGTETPDAGRRSNQDAVNDSALAVHAPTLAAQLAQALGEIDRLREEAERLQWLLVQQRATVPEARVYFRDSEVDHLRWTIIYQDPDTLRAAIDAARKEPKP